MANVRNGNTFYVDTASLGATAASFVAEKNILVSQIIFTASAAGDSVVISDLDPTTSVSAGDLKTEVKSTLADDTLHIDLADANMLFPNGIWISSIDAGANLTLVLKSRGG